MGKYFNFYFLGGIKVYKNSNFFHKNKGTVLLLALFVLFFTSAIIGIIYSYNSRIFKLAMEEKKNYSNFYNSFREVNTNLYMVKLMNYGFLFENWKWGLHYKPYLPDGTKRFSDPPGLTIEDVKKILFLDTENTIEDNVKNNLQSRFSIYGVDFTDRVRTFTYESGNLVVYYYSKLKIKIKNKIKDTVVFNELEYPIRLKIKYRITGSGDYGDQPPFNVKISVEEI